MCGKIATHLQLSSVGRYSAKAIANYFISKSLEMAEPLSAMKLIKLVYLAHAWYLAFKRKPLLNEPIEAWKFGPVISSLYHSLKGSGSAAISQKLISVFPESDLSEDPETRAVLDAVFDAYRKATPLQLSTWTHLPGTPWSKAWEQLGGKLRKHALIPDQLILAHFDRKNANPSSAPGL